MAERPSGTARRVSWSATLTIVSLAMFETLAQLGGWLPEPVGLLALIVVSCAFVGGSQGGLASAVLCVVFAIVAGAFGSLMFPWDARHFARASIAAYALPALALLVGMLRIQAQNRLGRYNMARAEADAAEQRYRDLIEGLGGVFWQIRLPERTVEFISGGAVSLFGWPLTHWLDRDRLWHDLVHSADLDRVLRAVEAAIATERPQVLSHRIVTAGGTVLQVRSLVQALRDDAGRLGFLRGVIVPDGERATGYGEQDGRAAAVQR